MVFSCKCDRNHRSWRVASAILVSLLFFQLGIDASSMTLVLSSKSTPFCNNALSMEHLQVACGGVNGECYFGTDITIYGSILANQKLTDSATLGVNVYIDGLVSRDLGYTDDVNLCNFLTPTYDDEVCPSAGSYAFNFTYNIPYLDDSAGWWFGYNNKIGVNLDITDSATDGTQFASTCHMVLVVTNLYDDYNSSSSSTYTQRLLYWSLLGMALMTGGFWIGYNVRRKCRVVCLEDLDHMINGGNNKNNNNAAALDDDVVMEMPSRFRSIKTDHEIIVNSAAFEILPNHPLGRVASIPTTQCRYPQPLDEHSISSNNRRQPLLNPLDEVTKTTPALGVQV